MLTSTWHDLVGALPEPRAGSCLSSQQAIVPGAGRVKVEEVEGASALVGCAASSPLQLLSPRPRGRAVWVVAASHGGGLVAGDRTELHLSVGPGATACLGTQAETKVYRAGTSGGARCGLYAEVGSGGLLVLLPDPVSPYAGSRYEQIQRFELEAGSSLALLDAVTSGRAARGERWALESYRSRNEVRVGRELVLSDALHLEAAEGPPLSHRLAGVELFATVVLLGPRVCHAGRAILAELDETPASSEASVLAVASPVADGILLRLAARSMEAGLSALRARLAFLADPLGGDPLLRRP
ncbi:MAG TPA: urease accessory protein UreD [Anaeromyxobacter sp.]|nr:urease accessory protein UreD [Anaeromyxobacter sp.]